MHWHYTKYELNSLFYVGCESVFLWLSFRCARDQITNNYIGIQQENNIPTHFDKYRPLLKINDGRFHFMTLVSYEKVRTRRSASEGIRIWVNYNGPYKGRSQSIHAWLFLCIWNLFKFFPCIYPKQFQINTIIFDHLTMFLFSCFISSPNQSSSPTSHLHHQHTISLENIGKNGADTASSFLPGNNIMIT